jgi:hypothetical protein
MSSLLALNRVYRLEIKSDMLVFSPAFCPSNLLSGILYTRIQCVGGVWYGVIGWEW